METKMEDQSMSFDQNASNSNMNGSFSEMQSLMNNASQQGQQQQQSMDSASGQGQNLNGNNNQNDQNANNGQGQKRQADQNQGFQQKRMRTDNYNNNKFNGSSFPNRAGKVDLRILLPSKDAGAIIGRGGANIKKLRADHKTIIQVPDCDGPERLLLIGGDTEAAVNTILDIVPLIKENAKSNADSPTEFRLLVHQSQAGCVIGRGGDKIKELRNKYNLDMKVYSECAPMSTERIAQMRGKPQDIVNCLRDVLALLESAPPKGMSRPYDPHNFNEFLSSQYGGYTSDKRGGGGGGGGGGNRGGNQGGNFNNQGNMGRNNNNNQGGGGGGGGNRGGSGGFFGNNNNNNGNNMGGGNDGGQNRNMRGGMGGGNRGRDGGGGGGGGMRGGMGGGNRGGRDGGGMGGGNRGRDGGGRNDNRDGGNRDGGNRDGGRGGMNRGGRGGGNMRGNNNNNNGFGGRQGNQGGGGGGGGGGGFNNGNNNFQNNNNNNNGNNGNNNAPGITNQVTIPNDLAGAIIGPKGQKIAQIREQSGAGITIDKPVTGNNERIITISGTPEQIQNAQYLLQMTVKQSGLWQGN